MRKGKLVAKRINDKLVQMGVDVSKVKCLGGDSTTLNTGVRNGIISQLERLWGHKVEWVTCLYHINELPMRKLLSDLDGVTKSPDSYSGINVHETMRLTQWLIYTWPMRLLCYWPG